MPPDCSCTTTALLSKGPLFLHHQHLEVDLRPSYWLLLSTNKRTFDFLRIPGRKDTTSPPPSAAWSTLTPTPATWPPRCSSTLLKLTPFVSWHSFASGLPSPTPPQLVPWTNFQNSFFFHGHGEFRHLRHHRPILHPTHHPARAKFTSPNLTALSLNVWAPTGLTRTFTGHLTKPRLRVPTTLKNQTIN